MKYRIRIRVGSRTRRLRIPVLIFMLGFLNTVTNLRWMRSVDTYLRGMGVEHVEEPKYLLYFTQGGWANQQWCLKKAFIMAKCLNRILLLPPVLPHFGKGATNQATVLTNGSMWFKETHSVDTDPFYHYLTRLPNEQYLPVSQVIDLDFTLPGVKTMDVRNFHRRYDQKSLTRATIEIDYGYSHYNTLWLYNQSEIEGTVEDLTINEYTMTKQITRTARDLPSTLGSGSSEDLLVFLDSFKAAYSENVLAAVPEWRPRMVPSIREAVRSTIASWPPYAAIHVRTGDGPFKQRSETTIRKVFQGVTNLILNWLGLNHRSLHPHNRRIGLYVATDLPFFRQHMVFAAEVATLTETVFQQYNVAVTILSHENVGIATDLLGGMLYTDIFLDLQIPVCAPIGVQGSPGSSFSSWITLYRRAEFEGGLPCAS
jgi:hypothetical protein